MKAHYKTENGRMTFELEGTVKGIFAGIAGIQEVFEADDHCGCCGRGRLRFRVRTAGDYEFPELLCLDCHAVLAFGEVKPKGNTIGVLFAKRKDGDHYLDNRGWKVWQPGAAAAAGDGAESAAQRTARSARGG